MFVTGRNAPHQVERGVDHPDAAGEAGYRWLRASPRGRTEVGHDRSFGWRCRRRLREPSVASGSPDGRRTMNAIVAAPSPEHADERPRNQPDDRDHVEQAR